MKKIFVADDDVNIAELIARYLSAEGFEVQIFHSGHSVLEAMGQGMPDMYVLDIMMPGSGGLELCREIRRRGSTPIIFVSARGEEIDRVLGLEMGADDYLIKPFSPRELVARVKNIFRRILDTPLQSHEIKVSDLMVSPQKRMALVGGNELELTSKEYQLLAYLAGNAGCALARQQILDKVWGIDYVGDARAVDDLVKRVRRKVQDMGSSVKISTVWGYGYKLHD